MPTNFLVVVVIFPNYPVVRYLAVFIVGDIFVS